MKLRVLENFAGIGTQRMALENLGIEHEVVGITEIDKFAIKSYEAIHGEVNNLGDISLVDPNDVPDHDLFTYSFPCQDISIAGKGKGFEKGSGTRSGLLWECEKVIRAKKPKYLLMENVKNLVSKKFKPGFEEWLTALEELGYTNYVEVLNAKDYGIPQNRERVFCVSILGEHEPYKFPEKEVLELRLKDVLEDDVDEKFYLDNEKAKQLIATVSDKYDIKETTPTDGGLKEPKPKEVANTILARYDAGISNQQSTGTMVIEPKVINPLKGKTNNGWHFEQQVYDSNGIARAVKAGGGSGNIPKVIEPKAERIGGIFDKDGERHQAGAVWDKEQLAPTLDTMKGGWRQPSILIKNNTKQGYVEATDGDGIDLSFPTSNTRRGRVQKELAQTLDTSDSKGVVVFNNDESTLYFYAKDNVLIDNVTLKNKFNNQLPFEPDYVYVDPYVIKNGEDILIINESMGQGEKIKQKEEIWVSEEVIHDTDYLDKLVNDATPKKEYGRMGRQAVETLNNNNVKHSDTINPFNKKVSSSDGVSPTLTTRPEGFKTAVLPISKDLRIRKLTPKECWRLMGISDEDFEKAQEVNSNTQLYKQAGNAIVVDVLEAIFTNMFK